MKESISSLSRQLVEVVPAEEGVGLGLRATDEAAKGDVLLEEEPLFMAEQTQRPASTVASFKKLPADRRSAILELMGHPLPVASEVGFQGEELEFLRILHTNAVGLPTKGSALYRTASRANHSCRPNAALCAGADGLMRLTALRPIHRGQEVLVSYIGEGELLRPRARRQELTQNWGFECGCERCEAEDDVRGMRCDNCGEGAHFPSQDGSWSACSSCGSTAPAASELQRAEEQWASQVASLEQTPAALKKQIALAMFSGLSAEAGEAGPRPSLQRHWLGGKLAALAAEAMLEAGQDSAAVEAASSSRCFAERALAGAASRTVGSALSVEAQAALSQGHTSRAARLLAQAWAEARPLPRGADGLKARLRELADAITRSAALADADLASLSAVAEDARELQAA